MRSITTHTTIYALFCWLALTSCGTPIASGTASVSNPSTTAFAPRAPRPTTTSTATPMPSAVPSATPVPSVEPPSAATVPQYTFPLAPIDAATYGPCHHDYPASDIFAPVGTQFVAVTDGRVDFVSPTDDWNPATDDPALRGGISVAMVGDDGVRYYGSHLSAVAEGIVAGTRVVKGQLLGLTGASGNAASTPPHLHFGISHPTTADDWQVRRGEINPYPYLNAWRDGLDITPDLSQPGGGVC